MCCSCQGVYNRRHALICLQVLKYFQRREQHIHGRYIVYVIIQLGQIRNVDEFFIVSPVDLSDDFLLKYIIRNEVDHLNLVVVMVVVLDFRDSIMG